MAYLGHFLPQPFGADIVRRVLPHQVGGGTVGPGRYRRIVGGFRPSLDLEGMDPRLCQLVQVLNEAQILGIEDIAVPAVLLHRVVLPRTLFLHQGIFPAAGLGAGAAVGIPPGKILGKQAPPGNAHAHRPVDEYLYLQLLRDAAADPLDLGQRQLPCQHHPFGAQTEQLRCGKPVCDPCLGGDMKVQLRYRPMGGHQHPHIAHDSGIHPHFLGLGKVARQQLRLLIGQQGVAGQVQPLAAAVGQRYRLGQLLLRKAFRPRPHIKQLPAQIHGVRPEAQRRLQPFPVPGRDQNLGFCFYHSVSFSPLQLHLDGTTDLQRFFLALQGRQ